MIDASYKPRECFNHLGESKLKYATKSEAKLAIRRLKHTSYKGVPMQRGAKAYKCAYCNFYHIGHK